MTLGQLGQLGQLGECVRAYSKTQYDLSAGVNSSAWNRRKKKIYFYKFSENVRLFKQELIKLLAQEMMSYFLGHSVYMCDVMLYTRGVTP